MLFSFKVHYKDVLHGEKVIGVVTFGEQGLRDDSSKQSIREQLKPDEKSRGNDSQPSDSQEKSKQQEQLLLPEMVNSDKVRIRLTGGRFAYLLYPLDLTKKDIQILTKQIEQLDLTIE